MNSVTASTTALHVFTEDDRVFFNHSTPTQQIVVSLLVEVAAQSAHASHPDRIQSDVDGSAAVPLDVDAVFSVQEHVQGVCCHLDRVTSGLTTCCWVGPFHQVHRLQTEAIFSADPDFPAMTLKPVQRIGRRLISCTKTLRCCTPHSQR